MQRGTVLQLLSIVLGVSLFTPVPGPAWGQSTGTVTGSILEGRGGIPGATVSLSGSAGDYGTLTGESGRFLFPNVRPGEYQLSVTNVPLGYWVLDPSRTIVVTPGTNETTQFAARAVKVITINVRTDSAKVSVDPDPLVIRSGDSLEWRLGDIIGGEGGAFAIQFEPISPLTHRRLRTSGGRDSFGDRVRWGVFPGSYRYFIAVEVSGVIYTEDPELIDENGDNPPVGDTTGVGGRVP